jgi:hypothetical protein
MDIIIGGGRYGSDAVEFLRKKDRDFVLVDTNPECLAAKRCGLKLSEKVKKTGECFIRGDLATSLQLITELKPEYVFPTAPIHIVAELAKIKFDLEPWEEAINQILPRLPQSVVLNVGRGNLVVSYNRDKDCQQKCGAPEVCPVTKIRKPCTMDRLMRFACPEGFHLISYLMSPGMGALKGNEILEFFDSAEKKDQFVVATTCDCHGVFTAFKKAKTKRIPK